MLLGTVAVTLLYLFLNAVFLWAGPVEAIAGQADVAARVAGALGGSAMETLVRLCLALAMVTSVSSMMMIGPRVTARMADDGVFPRAFRFTGEVPGRAVALQAAVALLFLWSTGLREQLSNLGWLLSLCTAASVVGLIRLRRREGPTAVPVPGWPWVPGLFLACTLGTAALMARAIGLGLWPAAAVLVSGAAAWLGMRSRRT